MREGKISYYLAQTVFAPKGAVCDKFTNFEYMIKRFAFILLTLAMLVALMGSSCKKNKCNTCPTWSKKGGTHQKR